MPLHWNKARFYKGTVGVSHGILVLLIRHTKHFWTAYRDMLRIQKKEGSDSKELQKLMQQLELEPSNKKIATKKAPKVLNRIKKEFNDGLTNLNTMFSSIDNVAKEDETLLYRAMEEIAYIYARISEIHNHILPEHRKHTMLEELYKLMEHIDHLQKHTWTVSKAHSRGFNKVSDMTLISSYKERRLMRKQTLELNHILNRIGPLKEDILRLKYAKTQREAHTLHDRIVEMIQLYHKEITDIHHIIQEAHIFTRRTEKLFKYMEAEAHNINEKELKHSVHAYAKKFHKIHFDFEKMARREYQDIHILFKRATPPTKLIQQTKPNVYPLFKGTTHHPKKAGHNIKKAA